MPDRFRHNGLLFAFLLMASLWPPAGHTEPDRSAVRSDLNNTLQALDAAAKEQEKISAKRAEMDKELAELQQDLVETASTLQARERTLSELEESIHRLSAQEEELAASLKKHRKEIDTLLMGMAKLSIVPPEMVLAMPGDFNDTLRTAKVLGLTSSAIQDKAEILKAQLEEAQRLHLEIAAQREQVAKEQEALQANRAALEKKLAARGKMQDKLTVQQKAREKEVKKLAADSKSLRDLLDDLEARWQEDAKRAAKLAMTPQAKPSPSQPSPAAIRKNTAALPDDAPAKSTSTRTTKATLPAEGKITLAYGEKSDDGEESRGIRIATRGSAAVTAPLGGEVVYTGPFLDYGKLIILRHDGKYHSLLAGLDDIQCKPGQKVLRGEPVGRMGNDTKSTRLYVEIRKNNRPIDPIPWLESQKLASR